MRRKIAAGNWKMNAMQGDLAEASSIANHPADAIDVVLCPPATLLAQMSALPLGTGGQDCHANSAGAHTGDIAASQLRDAGASYTLTGHSERRTDHGETNAMINAKSVAAIDAGLIAIICIGETLSERENGSTLTIIDGQLAGSIPDCATALNTVIAYEPVWAIGTGKIPSTAQIGEVHDHIRAHLQNRFADGNDMRILYGGSVKASNAQEIFAIANVDGALVGGASLKAADFTPIMDALAKA